MTKTTPIMTMMIVMVIGTMVLGTAFAIAPWDEWKIKFKGPVECTTASGTQCGTGMAKSKVQLLTQEVNEGSSSGIGKIKTTVSIGGGWDFDDEFMSRSLDWYFDESEVNIQGEVKSSNGSIWQLDMVVEDIDFAKKKGVCSFEVTNSIGDKISQAKVNCRVVMVPIEA